ncbi:glycosyltransferase [Paraflavitalea sp. CAU 1676]|uniref:glycosyltransferase n=1 Tax=Paraflavitalea sp. CAU 1676 TaxID=3032598 RepID=UPI0023DC65FA|nr:glycosyltransferase [Paraflavitalea sp. CAU 1676]MDF2188457.1 glycosyltransferase [Paraflavitalea sp. CAU 1676]
MKKIVHLNFSLTSGGSENLLIDIANEQAQFASVTIIIINNRYQENLLNRIDREVRVHTLNRQEGNKRSILFLIRLWALLLRIQPTVIHCHHHALIRLLPGFRQKAVLTAHCLGIATAHLKKYKQVYSISGAVAQDIRQRCGIVAPVVPNGIHFIQVTQKQDYTIDRNRTVRIVQVGRLVHLIKGQDLLLQALQQVVADKRYQHTTVEFIGTGPSQDYLEAMVHTLSLEGHVHFPGERSRHWIYQHLGSYDLLVQPSRSEGFGLTILEGIAAGLPVIASNHAGPREILQDMPGCYLFEPGDVAALSASIRNLIDHIRENDVQSKCETSRTLAGRQYSIRNTAKEYLRHYAMDL